MVPNALTTYIFKLHYCIGGKAETPTLVHWGRVRFSFKCIRPLYPGPFTRVFGGFFNSLCSRIHRTADTVSLWKGDGFVDITNINLGEKHHTGIDAAFAWSLDALGGRFTTNLVGTYVLKRETTFTPNDKTTSIDCAGAISQVALSQYVRV